MNPYYDDGSVTIYHGDCREVTEWLAADVLVTDPPYGISWPASALHSEKSKREASTPSIVGDQDTSARDAVLAMWGGVRPAIVFGSWRKDRPPNVTHRLIWHKAGRHPGVSPAAIFPADEEVYLLGGGWIGGPMASVITTHEQRAMQPRLIGHPTPKPIDLMVRLLGLLRDDAVIADPFMGSGSTLRAAKDIGRRAIGIEVEERYCEIAAKRLAQEVLPL